MLYFPRYNDFRLMEAMVMNFACVAIGGALGAVSRYAISLIPAKADFPILTLVTNILGALLIGFVVGVTSDRENVSGNMVLFWKTGVCGGFTTFSTFSLEVWNLLEKKRYAVGGIYAALSLVCCVFGVVCGKKLSALIRG